MVQDYDDDLLDLMQDIMESDTSLSDESTEA